MKETFKFIFSKCRDYFCVWVKYRSNYINEVKSQCLMKIQLKSQSTHIPQGIYKGYIKRTMHISNTVYKLFHL